MTLNYLEFEYAEDSEGVGSFEAVASVRKEQLPAVEHEMAQVLVWAFGAFSGQRGPVHEGGDWDYDLHGVQEWTAPESIEYEETTGKFLIVPGPAGKPRHTVSFTLSGTPEFCLAFRRQFELDESY